MNLKTLVLATTTLILLGSTAALAKPATSPSLSVATDSHLSDLPTSNKTTIPENLSKDNTPPTSRGIICKPEQAAKDCDERIPMQSRNHPWSAIGRLHIGENGHCTATLIEDDWLLTNAHCAIDMATHKLNTQPLSFSPNMINGAILSPDDRANVIGVVVGTDFSDSAVIPHPNDWALLKIDRPLGKKYGTIGWKALPSQVMIKNANKFYLAGYSLDFPDAQKYKEFSAGPSFTAGIHQGCSITAVRANNALIHDCDMRGGASGSPIIAWINGQPYIVAINSAEFANQTTGFGSENYATNINRLDDWFAQQRRSNATKP
jgi:protease YdgD